MKNKKISESMKKFWEEKGKFFLEEANKKRSDTLKKKCVWIKKENEKPFPCNIELILSRLAEGFLLVNTKKNKEKVKIYFGEVPDFFWSKKK